LLFLDEAPTKAFVERQILSPIGVRWPEGRNAVRVQSPALGESWTFDVVVISNSDGSSRSSVSNPELQKVRITLHDNSESTPQQGEAGAGGAGGFGTVSHLRNSSFEVDRFSLNLFEIGLNRQLCADPWMRETAAESVLGWGGRLYLDALKRQLTGQLDAYHSDEVVTPYMVNKYEYIHLGAAHLNRLNHSMYRTMDFPASTLSTMGMLNLCQSLVEIGLTEGVPGDLMETGVWRGGHTILMKAVLMAAGKEARGGGGGGRNVWVVDTFDGIPPPRSLQQGGYKGDETREWEPGLYAASLRSVQGRFARHGLLDNKVKFLQGTFDQTLPTAPVEKLMLLRLDGDTYEATYEVLQYMYSKLSPGGWVIVDDFHLHGCRRAVQQFRRENGITDPLFPVPEDYMWGCNQNDPAHYHATPQKRPQGAYWRKARPAGQGAGGVVPPPV